MSLKDRIAVDNHRVFMRTDHFADDNQDSEDGKHTWNGIPFTCVTDDEEALKRKNNNVNDISWDNNTRETTVYVPKEDWPGRLVPNETGFFDNMRMKILQIQEDMGMLTIVLTTVTPKPVVNDE